jgi:hypothetical protein
MDSTDPMIILKNEMMREELNEDVYNTSSNHTCIICGNEAIPEREREREREGESTQRRAESESGRQREEYQLICKNLVA